MSTKLGSTVALLAVFVCRPESDRGSVVTAAVDGVLIDGTSSANVALKCNKCTQSNKIRKNANILPAKYYYLILFFVFFFIILSSFVSLLQLFCFRSADHI